MKKSIVALSACAMVTVSILAQGMTADAGLISKNLASSEKASVNRTYSLSNKIAERKEALRSLGASEDLIKKLDRLKFFQIDFDKKGSVDVSTMDKVNVILQDSNIDIDIYINLITINK